MKKKFLITGYNLNDYHGSMMHISELAKVLSEKNFEVYITGIEISKNIVNFIESKSNAKVYFIDKLPVDIEYDYVLIHHDVILPYLLDRGLKYKKIATMSLSAIENIEHPGIQSIKGVPLFVHSIELQNMYKDEYNIEAHIFLNSVTNEFDVKIQNRTKLKNIAIVSNHLPKELVDVCQIFKKNNYDIDVYGTGYKKEPITAAILKKYDLIITIGKTVQYALYMGIPVYNYDRLGGIGYIRNENINIAEKHNFSGRDCFRKLNSNEIFQEIISQYLDVLNDMHNLKQLAKERYSLEKNIDNLLEIIDNSVITDYFNTPEWKMYSAVCIDYCKHIIKYKHFLLQSKKLAHEPIALYKLINKITLGKCFRNKLMVYYNLEKYQSMLI